MKADQVTFPPYTLFSKHSPWFGRCTKFVLRPYSNSLHFCLPFIIQTAYTRVIPASTCFYNTCLYRLKPFLYLHKIQLSAYTVWAEVSGEPENMTALHTYWHSPFLVETSGRSIKRISVQCVWEADEAHAFTSSAANTTVCPEVPVQQTCSCAASHCLISL